MAWSGKFLFFWLWRTSPRVSNAPSRSRPLSVIGSRMITAEPDITRLLGRLKGLKLIEQECAERDRRVVWTWITSAGLELLGHMKAGELKELIRLLEAVRKPSQE